MERELKISCPGCGVVLIVDRVTGEVLETRKPLVENSTGDRLSDAFLKVKKDKEKRDSIFDNMEAHLEQKKKTAEDLFNESLKSASKDPDKKPLNIFDMD
ncbi:MAG: hypothetical protein HY751_10885 [Nitrospinae bacterium]|nr:hypothetical protein [Nitrospinota bacterium]